MTLEDCVTALMDLPEVTEETPFGPEVLVYKVCNKMFATVSEDKGVGQMNLKCDPDRALDLRDQHESIIPGYHMNKKHWNTLIVDGSLPSQLVRDLIEHSYQLVVSGLKKVDRERLTK